jgi:hypothetical protein
MRSPSAKPSRLARFAAPVILSLALHSLLVLAIWRVPTSQPVGSADADPSLAPTENDCLLRLDDSPSRTKSVAPTPKPREDRSLVQATFEVHLAPLPAAPAPLPPKRIASPDTPGIGADAPAASPGGSGDGSGNGNEACALPVGRSARSVVYVVDRSMSMGFHGAFVRARREVLASLRRLGPETRFQVIAYNRDAEPLRINGRYGLLDSDENTIRQVAEAVTALRPAGGTNHGLALRRALVFHPDLIYFLTDADDVNLDDVKTVTRLADHRTIIHTVELNGGRKGRLDGPLHRLAADNGGTYRRLDPEE